MRVYLSKSDIQTICRALDILESDYSADEDDHEEFKKKDRETHLECEIVRSKLYKALNREGGES